MSLSKKILIVDDELSIRKLLRLSLQSQDCLIFEAETAGEALEQIQDRVFDLIILDLGLPDRDGLEVLKDLRTFSKVPVIILTVRNREQDKVKGLDSGADDYLVKPFSLEELKARVRVALRHSINIPNELIFEMGSLRVDTTRRKVFVHNQEVDLSNIEFQLLNSLCRRNGRIVPVKTLREEIWGPQFSENSHYLRIYIGHLRKKLSLPQFIITEPGLGYRVEYS